MAHAPRLIIETRVGTVVAVAVGSGVKVGVGVSVGVAVGSGVVVAGGTVEVAVAVGVGEPVGTRVTVGMAGATVDTRGETDCEVVQADKSTVIPSVAKRNINL